MHIHNIALSFDDLSTVSTDIKIKQNDGMAHKFIFGGLDFSDAERAVIRFLRSDGVAVCDDISYNDDTAEYIICPGALAASGSVKAEISLYDENMRITSCSFSFEVVPDINVDFALTNADTFPVFDSMVKDMSSLVKKENGKALSTNDYTDNAKDAVEGLGYSVDPNSNLPSYSSNSVWSVNKLKAEDCVTGGLQVGTYIMLNTKNGLRDVVYGSSNLQTALDSKVGFSDYATSDKAGVVAIEEFYGLHMDANGVLQLNAAEADDIDNRKNSLKATFKAITCTTLDYAVRSVRPNVVELSDLDIDITCEANTIYTTNSFAPETLKITLPSTGQYGDFIQVDFYTGDHDAVNTSLTVLSPTAGLEGYDLNVEVDCIYSLYFDWGCTHFGTNGCGWRFGYAAYPHEEV